MTTTMPLSAAEFNAIGTILAEGGDTLVCGPEHSALLVQMQERGLVRMHGYRADPSGRTRADIEVRAAGCIAFNAEQWRRALLSA